MNPLEFAQGLPDFEPLLTDWEVSIVEGRLRDMWNGAIPDNTRFVTFVQDAQEVLKDGQAVLVPPVGVFACISPHPTSLWSPKIMTFGATTLAAFHGALEEQKRLSNGARPDPTMVIFGAVLKNHMETLDNLRGMIH